MRRVGRAWIALVVGAPALPYLCVATWGQEGGILVMNSDHTEAWREYLVGQMQEQRGVASQEAQRIVDKWLGSGEANLTSGMAEESTEEERKA
jgi:hypothetical protein